MFRQVQINYEHKDFQRIVWRESIDEPIKIFRLLTVTYGLTPVPYLGIKCLRQIAHDEGDYYLLVFLR